MKKLLLILFLSTNAIIVKAYENEYFEINIPNEYSESIIENNTYKWIYNDNYISITMSDNINEEHNVYKYNKNDIEKQKNYIKETTNNILKEYNTNITVDYIDKLKNNNQYYLKYKIYWPTVDIIGYDTYQIVNIYTTNKYIFTLTYSSSNEINENNEYTNIINSFIIKDKTTTKIQISTIIISIITFILILLSIKTIYYYKNKK